MIVKKLEVYLKDIIKKRKGVVPSSIKAALLPLSWCYGLGAKIRNWFYDRGWMRRYVPPVSLVISIGNIVAGGTGKTPFTLFLAKAYYDRYKLAILSRGYRSRAEKLEAPLLLSEGEGPLYPASFCGDEPYIYAQHFPKAIVIVGGNRRKASFLAAKEGAQVILLDDAMQHRRLARDFDVVLIDAGDPFGHGHFLPRGFLREDRESLGRAHLLVINHITDSQMFTEIKKELQLYSQAPVIGVKGAISGRLDFEGKEVGPFLNQRMGMFCTIAHPEYFRRTLESDGAFVVAEYCMPDHDSIKERGLARFALQCKEMGAAFIVCTEKDRVKLPDQLDLSLPIVWVKIEINVVEGNEEWTAFLSQTENILL
ncbi:MAG: tetraacyldisaccharide 4'-kinase [Candidatus Protochlamydia sp.]|nr:tetraacyldisaccharide 4'-kinase [Candidatus Protochlamydia sp.]